MATALVTGGSGFIGTRIIEKILQDGGLSYGGLQNLDKDSKLPVKVIVLDQTLPSRPIDGVQYVIGDLLDKNILEAVVTRDTKSIFHFAAVLSGAAEADHEAGMRVNFDGTRALLERCRDLGHSPRFIFSSSIAVFGLPPIAVWKAEPRVNQELAFTEGLAPFPRSSYGAQKAMGELLLVDATRRGWVEGRSLRFPTIVVRPGESSATSSFASSIIREPLKGKPAVCPVSPDVRLWIQSPRQVVQNILHAHMLKQDKISSPTITLPGLKVSAKGVVDAVVAAGADSSLITWKRDDVIDRIVSSWPGFVHTPYAEELGFKADKNIHDIIQAYIEDDMKT